VTAEVSNSSSDASRSKTTAKCLQQTLPDDVVSACSVNSFKKRFDSIGRGFSLYYDYKSDI